MLSLPQQNRYCGILQLYHRSWQPVLKTKPKSQTKPCEPHGARTNRHDHIKENSIECRSKRVAIKRDIIKAISGQLGNVPSIEHVGTV